MYLSVLFILSKKARQKRARRAPALRSLPPQRVRTEMFFIFRFGFLYAPAEPPCWWKSPARRSYPSRSRPSLSWQSDAISKTAQRSSSLLRAQQSSSLQDNTTPDESVSERDACEILHVRRLQLRGLDPTTVCAVLWSCNQRILGSPIRALF